MPPPTRRPEKRPDELAGTADAVWKRQAEQWQRVGAPLRPSGEDLALYESVLLGRVREKGPLRAKNRGFHAFKLRLLMAVQESENIRVRIGDAG